MRVKVFEWPAPHVKENLGHWRRDVHEREINNAIALVLGRKCIEWQIHTLGHCEEDGSRVCE